MAFPAIKVLGGRKTTGVAVAASLAVGIVANYEGLSTAVYYDPVGIPTQCFGETKGVRMGDAEKTPEQCKAMLVGRLEEFSDGIDKCLTRAIPPEMYAAYLSAAYNIGIGNFCNSSMARKTNAGDFVGGCNALLLWDKARKAGVLITLPGLTKRRHAERDTCMRGAVSRDTGGTL